MLSFLQLFNSAIIQTTLSLVFSSLSFFSFVRHEWPLIPLTTIALQCVSMCLRNQLQMMTLYCLDAITHRSIAIYFSRSLRFPRGSSVCLDTYTSLLGARLNFLAHSTLMVSRCVDHLLCVLRQLVIVYYYSYLVTHRYVFLLTATHPCAA